MLKRQQTFAQLVASGLPQTDAAIQAGYAHGSAHVKASQLMRDPAVKKLIAKLKRDAAKGIEQPVVDEPDNERKLKDRYDSPLAMFLDVMNNPRLPMGVRYKAAQDAAKYTHAKPAPKTKKDQAKQSAIEASGGGRSKFATGEAPSHTRQRVN